MTIAATTTWYVRKSGAEINGGGFDPSIAGAGTNYADQDAPQLSITDLVSTASTTVTSANGGFTAAMIGNVLRLASATGSPVADSAGSRYLVITGVTDTNTATVDKTSGTYTAGVAKVGGAHATLVNMSSVNGGAGAPVLTSPLVPGNTVYVRSAGSAADPSIGGTPDYTHTGGYWSFPAGTQGAGMITFMGLGAAEAVPTGTNMPAYRPLIKHDGMLFYLSTASKYWRILNFKSFCQASPTWHAFGFAAGGGQCECAWNIMDTNGQACSGFTGLDYSLVHHNWVKNTGTATSSGTDAAFGSDSTLAGVGTHIFDNLITNCRGPGIALSSTSAVYTINGNVIAVPAQEGIKVDGVSGTDHRIFNNTIYGPVGSGITITPNALRSAVYNNTVSEITTAGKFGIAVTSGSAAVSNLLKSFFDYNNVYVGGGAGSAYDKISAGSHDTNVDPVFTNTATFDFSIGTNLRAAGLGIKSLT